MSYVRQCYSMGRIQGSDLRKQHSDYSREYARPHMAILESADIADGRNQIYIPSSMIWEKSYSLGHATLM
jgi:hypothetical protein